MKDVADDPAATASPFVDPGLRVLLEAAPRLCKTERHRQLLADLGEVMLEVGPDVAQLLRASAECIVGAIADWCCVELEVDGQPGALRVLRCDPSRPAVSTRLECRGLRRGDVGAFESLLVSEVTDDHLASLARDDAHLALLRELAPTSLVSVPLVAREHLLGWLTFGSLRGERTQDACDVAVGERSAARIALAVENARLREALERAVAARDDVLAMVAHDLRNPLNTIVLESRLLGRGWGGDDRVGPAASHIHLAAMRMNHLIQDLLEVARLEAGHTLAMEPSLVESASLVGEAIARQRTAFEEAGRTLVLDPAASPASVHADGRRILQVLDNLLGNAAKFARRAIRLGAAPDGTGSVRFWVADDGVGIRPDDLPRVFDRFWQARKTDHRGTGLGLWIVKEIIEAHGGRIWAESLEGGGTTFSFTLPRGPLPA